MSLLQNSNAISEGGYNIANSLRFQSASSQSLTRTFSTPTDAKKWTWSGWIKRANLTADQVFFGSAVSTAGFNESRLCFLANNTIRLLFQNGSSTAAELVTTPVYRDPSAWYHLVIVVDTNNATSTDRVILYINGSRVTAFSTATYPSLSASFNFNTAVQHALGAGYTTATQTTPNFGFTDGYLTEVNFVDGQALTPSSFGETNTLTGQWVAKKYTGTYGTNGFYLPFSNGTSTTTLGYDSSGNSNNWTLNNFTRSAGASDCWMYDVPSGNGSVVGGTQPNSNYCVMNPLDKASVATTSNANLRHIGSSIGRVYSSVSVPSSGLFYAEFTNSSAFNSSIGFGFGLGTASASRATAFNISGNYSFYASTAGYLWTGSALIGPITFTNSANQTFQIAIDATSGKVWLGQNNTWWNSSGGTTGNPSAGTNPTFTIDPKDLFIFTLIDYNSSVWWDANFGQRSFAYTPPSGFKALCTANLPASTIVKGNTVFDATLYTGNGSTQTITNAAGFSPDFVWIKDRSAANYHGLFDVIRGAGYALYSNGTFAESPFNAQTLQSFNSNGFTVGSNGDFNTNGSSLVAWQWDAGSSTVTNTDGSISSQVRANPSAGVSIVTYTGTGSLATIGHGLGIAPKMLIVKSRSTADTWRVYHDAIGNTKYINLNDTSAAGTASTVWNNTSPSSTVFTVATESSVNGSGRTQVALCFAEIAGFSKFGSYTGNASADGNFLYFGFRPKYIMIKNITTNGFGGWVILDSSRNPSNVTNKGLAAESAGAEFTVAYGDFLSNGFKIRIVDNGVNASGQSYIYMAFAENPFAQANAR